MILLAASAVCYLVFLLFETFTLALDRLSAIKVRGLLEEHPERARLLAGPGKVEIVRTTTKVLVQVLLLTGLLTEVSGFGTLGVRAPWVWGGLLFVAGWLSTEVALLRSTAGSDPEATVTRLLPVVTAASWLLWPLSIPVRRIFEAREKAEDVAPATPATEEEVQAYIDVGRQEGILEKEEEKLLLSIVDLVSRHAGGPLRVDEVLAHARRPRDDRPGRRNRARQGHARRASGGRRPADRFPGARDVFRPGDEEGVGAPP